MVRVQIQLTEDQHRNLRRWAARLGVSFSEVVRRCVADRLELDAAEDPDSARRAALAVCGKYREQTDGGRVGRDHDGHLADAFRR